MSARFVVILPLLAVWMVIPGATTLPAQEQRPPDPQRLMQEADQDILQQHYSESAAKLKEAAQLFQQEQNRQGTALAFFKLGTSYSKIGRYPEGDEALRQAMKLHEEAGDRSAIGNDLTELAYIAAKQSDYEKSLELSHQALTIHEAAGNKKGIADCYRIQGLVYQFQGDHAKATEYSQRSLDMAVEIGDKEGQAQSLRNLGGVQWRLSNFDEALQYYGKALPLAEEIGDKKIQSQVIGNVGLVYWNRGQLKEALQYFDRSMDLAQEIGDLQSGAIDYLNMGAIYNDLEEYGKSEEMLQKSLTMAQQIGDKGLTSAALDSLGQLHTYLGDFDIALDLTKKAAVIAEEIGEKRTLAYELKSIATIYGRQGKYSSALASDKKALALYEELEEKRGIAATLNDMAVILLSLKNYNDSLPLYERALTVAGELKSPFIEADSYRGIGWIHYARKEMQEAESCFSKAVEMARDIDRPDGVWQSLYGQSLIRRDLGRTAEALTLMKEAVDFIEKARSEVQLSEQKAGYFEEKLDVYEDLVRLLIASNNLPEAFEYAQRSKARAFLDMLAESRIDVERNMNPDLRERKKKTVKELLETQQNIQDEYDKEPVDASNVRRLTQKRNELENELNGIMLEIRKEDPRFAGLQYPRPISLSDARALLDPQSILLEYLLGAQGSVVFVITQDHESAYVLPSETKLHESISVLRTALSKPEPVWESSGGWHTKYVELALQLYARLVGPAEKDLKGKSRLIIAPDGILNYLPFESLLRPARSSSPVDFSALPYLCREFEIQYVPSISALSALKENQQAGTSQTQRELIAFADPANPPADSASHGKSRAMDIRYAALPNARLEVESIARLFGRSQVSVFEGQEASEQNVKKSNLEEYKRLHFASHGAINEQQPRLSALVLSSQGAGEDGYLTMQEVFDLRLNADLVVLSACNTGLGQQVRGEGVMGLSRAFLCAGSSSVLASLWNVNDESTAGFMAAFYGKLKGSGKSAALKEARLQMIRGKKFSHPYYWAPFVLIGNS